MEEKDEYKVELTDLSKVSVEDIQKASLCLFGSPMRLPKESPQYMTIEEFILKCRIEDNEE